MISSVDAVEDIVHVAFSLGFLIRSTKAANRRTVPRGGSAAVQDDIGLDDRVQGVVPIWECDVAVVTFITDAGSDSKAFFRDAEGLLRVHPR